MKVLSLFDGISCGMVALERIGIQVERYYAYEKDPNPIKISKKNYPNIIHLGDVFDTDFCQFAIQNIDILMGGSPCTFWSIAQPTNNRETTATGLGWELFSKFLEALRNAKPKYFIYENNKSMSREIKESISSAFGFEPICINSALVSAQTRQRYYWVGKLNADGTYSKLHIEQPKDKGILLSQIIESGNVDRKKSLCLTRRYAGFTGSQSYLCRRYFGKSFGQAVFEGDIEKIKMLWRKNPYFESEENNIRPMTITECARLQTLPDNYTKDSGVSDRMQIEAIGNGWTVDVIAHILSHIPNASKCDVNNKKINKKT